MQTSLPEKVEKHVEFYLPHGDVVLCSASGEDGVSTLFRIHKGVLSYNSPVFAGMFDLPAPGGSHETYEGALLVCIPDSKEEVESFVSALYKPTALSYRRWDPAIPLRLRGVMKLAMKYGVESLQRRVTEIMEESWPTTLPQWIRFNAEYVALKKKKTQIIGLDSFFVRHVPEPAAAIRFGEDFDMPSILPFAFYTLATITAHYNFDDRSLSMRTLRMNPRLARWSLLDAEDLARLIRGREAVATHCRWIMDQLSPEGGLEGSISCENEERCASGLGRISETVKNKIFGDSHSMATPPDLLGVLEEIADARSSWDICDPCSEAMIEDLHRRQQNLWDRLPSMFSVAK